jgi:hypothetical protein
VEPTAGTTTHLKQYSHVALVRLGLSRQRRLVGRLVLEHHDVVGVQQLDEALLLPLLHLREHRFAKRRGGKQQHDNA